MFFIFKKKKNNKFVSLKNYCGLKDNIISFYVCGRDGVNRYNLKIVDTQGINILRYCSYEDAFNDFEYLKKEMNIQEKL